EAGDQGGVECIVELRPVEAEMGHGPFAAELERGLHASIRGSMGNADDTGRDARRMRAILVCRIIRNLSPALPRSVHAPIPLAPAPGSRRGAAGRRLRRPGQSAGATDLAI